jgi:copper(I)-binding protein
MRRFLSLTRASGPDSRATACKVVALAVIFIASSTVAFAGGITIESPWLRFIIKDRPAASYFTLRNDTDQKVELTGASSSGCGMMMLHQSTEAGGVDKMSVVESVAVPAHGTLQFTPGSYHLMCMNPQSTVAVGGAVSVILKFADGRTINAVFPVKGPGG